MHRKNCKADKDGYIKGFYVFSDTSYNKSLPKSLQESTDNKIMVGIYHKDGGCKLEFVISFYHHQDGYPPWLRLEMFDGAFLAFETMPEFFRLLEKLHVVPSCMPASANQRRVSISKRDFIEKMKEIGLQDITE